MLKPRQGWSLWSKDIIFLLVAEPMAGTSIWLEAYHSDAPRYSSSLSLKSGEIQAAIQLSHPDGTHFQSISVSYEGANGQLANLDLINSAVVIAGGQVRVPITVQGVDTYPNNYEKRLKTLLKGMVQQSLGLSMGSGTFGRYKVDAITLRAEGANGDHDGVAFGRSSDHFYVIDGYRVIESLCRSLNNLLEHLHQSFFFYFILSPTGRSIGDPGKFVSIGTYLPAAMILAAAFSVTAVTLWIQTRMMTSPAEKIVQGQATKKSEKESAVLPPVSTSMGLTSLAFSLSVISILYGTGFLILVNFDWIQKTSTTMLPVPSSFLFHANEILGPYCGRWCTRNSSPSLPPQSPNISLKNNHPTSNR